METISRQTNFLSHNQLYHIADYVDEKFTLHQLRTFLLHFRSYQPYNPNSLDARCSGEPKFPMILPKGMRSWVDEKPVLIFWFSFWESSC